MSRVHVLAPVHNRRAVTERFVRCLKAQTHRDLRLVLVDDGSTDGTAEMVASLFPEATILRGDGTLWWGGSLQRGHDYLRTAAAADDIILIANDDVVFEADFIENGVAALLRGNRNLLLAQLYDAVTGRFVEAGVRVDWANMQFHPVSRPEDINCFSTRGLFLRCADMMEIGGFRPKLLPHYASDYEYTLRARRKGFRFSSSPDVKLAGFEDEKTTGIRGYDGVPFGRFMRVIFTKRALHNPVYWTSFVVLSCPWRYVPFNLYRVWRGFYRQARAALRVSWS